MSVNEINGNHKHFTNQIRDFAIATDARIDAKVTALGLATNAVVTQKIADHSAAADPHAGYLTDAEMEAKIVSMLVAGPGISLAYSPPGHSLTISKVSTPVYGLTQSTLSYEVDALTGVITFVPSCSDWVVNQQSIVELSTSNTFPVGANTELQAVTLTSAMVLGQQTTGVSFTRPVGTYYAKHWRVDPFGVISPDSAILTVTVPADPNVTFVSASAFGGVFGVATNPSFTRSWNIGSPPAAGKKRYGIFSNIYYNAINASVVSSVTINGVAVTPFVVWGATGSNGFAHEMIIELPTGTTADILTTMSAGPGRSAFGMAIVTIAATKTLAVDNRYISTNALAASSVAATIGANQLAIVTSYNKYTIGPAAVPVETFTGATLDITTIDGPGNVAASGNMIAVGHTTVGGTITGTTSPTPSTGILDHEIWATVLKAV